MRQSLLLTSALLLAASASARSDAVDSRPEPAPEPEPQEPTTPRMVITSQWTSAPRFIEPELFIRCRKCQAPPHIDCNRSTLGRHRFHLCRVQDAAALAATGAA